MLLKYIFEICNIENEQVEINYKYMHFEYKRFTEQGLKNSMLVWLLCWLHG